MAYVGNLTCRDCGLTFTARWGSYQDADEYRCGNDHVIHVHPSTGTILAIGAPGQGFSVSDWETRWLRSGSG